MNQAGDDTAALEILRTDELWIEAFNARDLDTLVRLYDVDAIVMPPGRPELRGREAIREWLARFFAEHTARQTLVNDEIAVHGDWAFMRGRFQLAVTPRGAAELRQRGKHLVIWKRQPDGSWHAARDIWNLDG